MTDAIRKQISCFESLQEGWHFGEGVGANEIAVKSALDVYDSMIKNRIEIIKVFPEIDGGIMISGYLKKETLEVLDVSCRPDGTMEMDHEIDNVDVFENTRKDLSLNDVEDYLEEFSWNRKKSYEYCIRNISVKKDKCLQVQHFVLPVGMEEFQSLVLDAPVSPAKMSAVISKNSIKVSQGTLPYFGESSPDNYQTILLSVASYQQTGISVTATSGI